MIDDEKLPLELVWDENSAEKHLSEIVRTVIADGQTSIVPQIALAHLQTCEDCLRAIGEAAMLSARIGTCLNEAAPARVQEAVVPVAPPVRIPWMAIAAALTVAALAAVPKVVGARIWYEQTSHVLMNAIPSLTRGLVTMLRGGMGAPIAVSYVSAALLLMVGITIGMRNSSHAMGARNG